VINRIRELEVKGKELEVKDKTGKDAKLVGKRTLAV
jgi:hypothetical protein